MTAPGASPRYILGICCYGKNDSGVCLLDDGKIVFAAEGERYTRVKHDTGFPEAALREALETAGIEGVDVGCVGFYTDLTGIALQTFGHLVRYFPRSLLFLRNLRSYIAHQSLEKALVRALGHLPPVVPVKHHLTHAASTFYLSPFQHAAILTIDGTGEFTTCTFGLGEGTRIRTLQTIRFPHSLGKLYESITQYLGFRPCSGEGKVMGLASYGDPEAYLPFFRKIVRTGPAGTFRLDMDYFSFHVASRTAYSRKLVRALGPPRIPEGPLETRHQDIAAALQRRVEEVGLHMVEHLHRLTGSSNLCLAGGVCLNCQMNSVLKEQGPFRELFVPPPTGDPGTAIGAAQVLYHHRYGGTRREELDTAFLGSAFPEEACLRAVTERGLEAERVADPAASCASELACGRIVGWFQGRMEIGPRALGNRSILADPRDPAMKDVLNERVKFREGFRPFAPAVLAEACGDYFVADGPSPFMLRTFRVRPEKKDSIPSVVHVDDTCRVQTVHADHHPLFARLIRAFAENTGVPVILNTSFNLRGEPIVRTPGEALNTFLRSGMDLLYLGDLRVRKPGKRQEPVEEPKGRLIKKVQMRGRRCPEE